MQFLSTLWNGNGLHFDALQWLCSFQMHQVQIPPKLNDTRDKMERQYWNVLKTKDKVKIKLTSIPPERCWLWFVQGLGGDEGCCWLLDGTSKEIVLWLCNHAENHWLLAVNGGKGQKNSREGHITLTKNSHLHNIAKIIPSNRISSFNRISKHSFGTFYYYRFFFSFI